MRSLCRAALIFGAKCAGGVGLSLVWRTMRLRGVLAGLRGCGCGCRAGQPVQKEQTLHLF